MLERLLPLVKREGTISVYFEHVDGEFDPSNFSVELGRYVGELLQPGWLGYRVSTSFAGRNNEAAPSGRRKAAFGYLVPSSRKRIPLLFGAMVTGESLQR